MKTKTSQIGINTILSLLSLFSSFGINFVNFYPKLVMPRITPGLDCRHLMCSYYYKFTLLVCLNLR